MSVDELIRTANIVFIFAGVVAAGVFGWLQVRGRNRGDAIKATSESIVMLSQRLNAMEHEREERGKRIDELQVRLDQLGNDNVELKKRNIELGLRLQGEIAWRTKLEARVTQLEKENTALLAEVALMRARG